MTAPSLLFAQNFLSALPEELPIFPLSGAVLLPRSRLPLNVFEARYRTMVEDALGHGRLIGMIQPSVENEAKDPALYSVGCAGRITSFTEIDDRHFVIVLSGFCRFRVIEEYPFDHPYRRIRPEWTPFLSDLGDDGAGAFDRERLVELMRVYFKKNGISVDWNAVRAAPDDVLLPTVIMICPLPPNEKQALLEAEGYAARASMLMALLEMATMPQSENETEVRH